MRPVIALRLVKLAHTLVWALLAGCVVAIPVMTYRGRIGVSAVLIGVVLLEVAVLAANRMRCPLTDVAARYTAERRDNFDIYLPLWLARRNQRIFGSLFAAGLAYTGWAWAAGRGLL